MPRAGAGGEAGRGEAADADGQPGVRSRPHRGAVRRARVATAPLVDMAMKRPRPKPSQQIGVQSVEVAGRLLKTLARLEGPQTLSALSTAAGLPPAKAHRYLVSFIREGLIEQNAFDGRYDFGGAAREVGRAAINRLDIVRIGGTLLAELRNTLQETMLLGVWGNEGPTVLYWLDVPRPVSIVIRPGSILPILRSALGLVCAAYLPPRLTEARIAEELHRNGASGLNEQLRTKADVDDELRRIRACGFGLVRGDLIRGIDALGVPILDHKS